MVELTRTLRFCLNGPDAGPAPPRHNNFSAWPPMRGLGRFYQLHVRCQGEPDPVTGYFVNIKIIDQAFRDEALPYLEEVVRLADGSAAAPMGELMRQVTARMQPRLGQSIVEARLSLTPYYSLTLETRDMDRIVLRQQYEFSAAHRLHVPELGPEQNREIFGKCNNPSGHGHNYRLEVAASAPIDPQGRTLDVEQLDQIVDEHVIEKLDHKHLNQDVPQFKDVNPSVENIAKAIHAMLAQPIEGLGAKLVEVSVWETTKTVCTYRGA